MFGHRGFEICYGTKEICKRARRKKQFKCFLRQNISRVTLIARRRVYISSVFRFWYRCLNAGLYSFVFPRIGENLYDKGATRRTRHQVLSHALGLFVKCMGNDVFRQHSV